MRKIITALLLTGAFCFMLSSCDTGVFMSPTPTATRTVSPVTTAPLPMTTGTVPPADMQ